MRSIVRKGYNTHKDKVHQYIYEYTQKERAEESSSFNGLHQRMARKDIMKTKNSPEEVERRGHYASLTTSYL